MYKYAIRAVQTVLFFLLLTMTANANSIITGKLLLSVNGDTPSAEARTVHMGDSLLISLEGVSAQDLGSGYPDMPPAVRLNINGQPVYFQDYQLALRLNADKPGTWVINSAMPNVVTNTLIINVK
jgi:hypothetical protein